MSQFWPWAPDSGCPNLVPHFARLRSAAGQLLDPSSVWKTGGGRVRHQIAPTCMSHGAQPIDHVAFVFSDSFQRVTMHRGRHPGDTREEAGGRYLPHGRRPRTAGQPASARQGSLLLSTFNESRAELVSDVHLFLPPLRFLNLGGFEARVIVSFPARTFNWQKR